MTKRKNTTMLAGAIALACAGNSVLAAAPPPPVGLVNLGGGGATSGFTIDDAGFSFADVDGAPCPAGSVCTNMTATTDNEILMREVDTGVTRYIQTILVDTDGSEEFTYETSVSSGGSTNAMAAKVRISDAAEQFFTEQSAYRGTLFAAPVANNNLSVEVFQDISGGFQTFDMETRQAPNQGTSEIRNGRLQILQPASGAMQAFGHTIVAGTFQTSAGTLTAGAQSISFVAGESVTATWVGGTMSGGGPGVILAPGQLTNHDTRPAADRDFGLLIYRKDGIGSPGIGNAGGVPTGLVNPQFTQQVFPPFPEARAISASGVTDTGLMYNPAHGAFTGGTALFSASWGVLATQIFGPNPY